MTNKERIDEKFLNDIICIDFLGIDDLFSRKTTIRNRYCLLTYDYKRIYKWYYFFKLSNLKNPLKRLMWEYINNRNVEVELNKEYMIFCEKRSKLRNQKKKK